MFSREDTRAVKGCAALLMLFHHLATWSDRFPAGFPGFQSLWPAFTERGYLTDLAFHAILCVPVFFFLGGYGLYKRYERGGFSLARAVWSLYRRYWKVFFLFIPLAFLCFSPDGTQANPLAMRYTIRDGKSFFIELLKNLTGYAATLNSEWWFFGAYLCVLPLGVWLCPRVQKRRDFLSALFAVVGIDILTQCVFPALTKLQALSSLQNNLYFTRLLTLNQYAPAFFLGVVFARFRRLETLKETLGRLPCKRLCCAGGCLAVLLCRAYVVGYPLNFDLFFAPAFVACCAAFLDGAPLLKRFFVFLGRHSMNVWLIHSFYCYYFRAVTRVVYCTRSVWIDLALLLFLSLTSSVLLEAVFSLPRRRRHASSSSSSAA